MKKILNLLFHPASLALIITIIIFLFLPPIFNKYQIYIVETRKINQPDVYSYHDLNSDGYSEEMYYHGPPASYPTFIIRDRGKIVDQKNFKGHYINTDFFIYCDYNNDSITEIFVLTINNDSIFLKGVNPYTIGESYFINLFVDKCQKYDGRYDCQAFVCNTPDNDNNGYNELVFIINTGKSKQPRNLYLVDIFNKTVIKSPENGTSMQEPICFDINNDGSNEYFVESYAFKNFQDKDSIDYPDSHTWLMVLDKNLNFIFEPKKFGQYKTSIEVKPFCTKENKYIVVLQKHQGYENIDSKIVLLNPMGNQIKERILTDFSGIEDSFIITGNNLEYNNLYLFYSNGKIEQIDSCLNTIKKINLPEIYYGQPCRIDIDRDGVDEFIFIQKERQGIIITRNDFTHPVLMQFSNSNGINSARNFSLQYNGTSKPNLYFQSNELGYNVEYSKNPFYSLRYLILILIYGVVFILFFILQKIQHIRARKKYETTKKLAELQLQSIKGQTDPHFTLNLIDSIGNLFYKRDSEKAAYVFGKYAKLLRTTILSSENISVSLEREIEYVRNFLDLEKFRYDEKFKYKIVIDKNVDTKVEIPKMLLHTFVENAIKHGLKHKIEMGKLAISIEKLRKSIKVNIHDNGIGRQKAREFSKLSTGKGLQILDKMLDLYFDLKKTKISYQITDLATDDEKSAGTLVIINIPLKDSV